MYDHQLPAWKDIAIFYGKSREPESPVTEYTPRASGSLAAAVTR